MDHDPHEQGPVQGELFSLYDADDDGKVTEEEWRDGAAMFGGAADVT